VDWKPITLGGNVASGKESSTSGFNTRKLECSWATAISISGMSPEHRKRVQEIGLDAWMEEYAAKETRLQPATLRENGTQAMARERRLTRIMGNCIVCRKRFPAKRSDAKYCSHKCQLRGHRRGLTFRGPNENIKLFCEP
jgi:hypothetical protein